MGGVAQYNTYNISYTSYTDEIIALSRMTSIFWSVDPSWYYNRTNVIRNYATTLLHFIGK